MSTVIKSTPEAIEAIHRMRSVIDGGLVEQLNALQREGGVLAEPFNWDGPLALQFRDTWPGLHGDLVRMQQELARLNTDLRTIQADIQLAGGA
jgi:uncharacterized protein YukE